MSPLLSQALEVSNSQLGLGVITALLAQHFVLRKYIRQQAGIKETTTTEISGQPLHFVKDEQPMTVAAHAAVCGQLGGRVSTLESEVKEIRKEMKGDKEDIIKAGEDRSVKIHDRINVAITQIGELKGQLTEVAKRV